MSLAILGIGLGQNSCSLVALDENGKVVLQRRVRRDGMTAFASKLPPCTVAAEAIAEAATRPTMRFVELNGQAQLDAQTLHPVQDRLVEERTSLTNQIRSLLLERGHTVAQGHAKLRPKLVELLDSGTETVSPRMAFLLEDMRTRWTDLDRRIAAFDAEFAAMVRTDERARRLTGIPGIGAARTPRRWLRR